VWKENIEKYLEKKGRGFEKGNSKILSNGFLTEQNKRG